MTHTVQHNFSVNNTMSGRIYAQALVAKYEDKGYTVHLNNYTDENVPVIHIYCWKDLGENDE